MNNQNTYLKLDVIWKDEAMMELEVSVNNGRYSGITEVYVQKEALLEFANQLIGFPKNGDILIYSAGEENSYAFFEMRFYQIDTTGKVGVQIILEENVQTQYREPEKSKLKGELLVEPNAVANFQKQLVQLAKTENGSAELTGIK